MQNATNKPDLPVAKGLVSRYSLHVWYFSGDGLQTLSVLYGSFCHGIYQLMDFSSTSHLVPFNSGETHFPPRTQRLEEEFKGINDNLLPELWRQKTSDPKPKDPKSIYGETIFSHDNTGTRSGNSKEPIEA